MGSGRASREKCSIAQVVDIDLCQPVFALPDHEKVLERLDPVQHDGGGMRDELPPILAGRRANRHGHHAEVLCLPVCQDDKMLTA